MIKKKIENFIRSIVREEMDAQLTQGIDVGTGTTSIRDDKVHVTASTPKLQLEGTEASAQNLSIRENAGAIELYDEAGAAVASSWDFNPGIQESDFATDALANWPHMNLLPEGAQTGLAADSTGVKYSGEFYVQLDTNMLKNADAVYLEAATNSSSGSETVTVELYDTVNAVVDDSFTISGGSNRARSADISASLTEGDVYQVRFNVTTAAASGSTFDANGARLVFDWGVA